MEEREPGITARLEAEERAWREAQERRWRAEYAAAQAEHRLMWQKPPAAAAAAGAGGEEAVAAGLARYEMESLSLGVDGDEDEPPQDSDEEEPPPV